MKNGRSPLLPIPVDGKLRSLIREAAEQTRLTQAEVMRSALRIGVPEVIKGRLRPRRNFVEYVTAFAGLVKRNRDMVQPSRFK